MDAETFTIQSVLDTMNKSLKDSGASVELKRRDERGNVVPAYVHTAWAPSPPNRLQASQHSLCMCVCVWQLLLCGYSTHREPKATAKVDSQMKLAAVAESMKGKSKEEKLEWGIARKQRGNQLFAAGEYKLACDVYMQVTRAFTQVNEQVTIQILMHSVGNGRHSLAWSLQVVAQRSIAESKTWSCSCPWSSTWRHASLPSR